MKKVFQMICFIIFVSGAQAQQNILSKLKSPIIFKGNDSTAFRDPAVLFKDDKFYLYFTLVKTESGKVYSYTAMSISKDLQTWSPIKIITPKDQSLDFCSPGNIIKYNNEWIMCLQTYPRPNYLKEQMPRFGTNDARLFVMRSKNLVDWSTPELMKVKGPNVTFANMGRMIDPYLIEDNKVKGKWWCFYKQNGVSMSYTYDMKKWGYFGRTESGENVCVLHENNEYILIHSPKNGIAIKKSTDLKTWTDWGQLITLGQKDWVWAQGRITAGVVLNMKKNRNINRYVMFFHGSGPLNEEQGDFDKNSSLGIAWSNDLSNWNWPSK